MVLLALILGLPVMAESPTVRITELHSNPAEGEREFVELWNPSNSPINITGWRIEDGAGNNFTMPSWTLAPDGRVVIWGGGEPDARGPAWGRSNAWNNGGDAAILWTHEQVQVDAFQYGSWPDAHAEAPPPGHSMQWAGQWVAGEPTPGVPYAASEGDAGFHVENLPPDLFLQGPTTARPAESVAFVVYIDDANGDNLAWSLTGPDAAINGTEAGWHNQTIVAPAQPGSITWTLEATDGTTVNRTDWTVAVSSTVVQVIMPDEGIQFPGLVPGARNVSASAPFVVRNAANDAVQPWLDVSPFRGPATVAVDGNLALQLDDGRMVPYDGPMTRLPDLAPGASHRITLVILDVPRPLPAGSYGTSFAAGA